jgi:hypothetical protein
MLWKNVNPIFEVWFFNVEFDDFLERCIVVGLEVESLSNIVNVVNSSYPL